MGVPLVTTDATGAVVTPTGYALSGFPGQFANAVLLPGAAHYYNRYRDYDPTTGRYIQADPIGLAGDPNPYAYALGNPLRYTDPTGEFVPILAAAAFGFAAGAGIDLAFQALANRAAGRSVSDPANYNPTQAAVSGALGGLSGGAGALFFSSARAAGLSGATICNTAMGAEAGRSATGFLGRAGHQLTNATYQKVRNESAHINGRGFSGHALDQMQNRGVMPSVVENSMSIGTRFQTRAGTTGFYDSANNVRVILNSESGRVVTVIRGAP